MSHFSPGFITALNGNDQYTKILLHFDGANGSTSIVDSALGISRVWTASGAVITTAEAKFGGAALAPGTGYITTPDSADLTLGSSDFAIEAWFYVSGGSGTRRAIAGRMTSTGSLIGFFLELNTSNVLHFLVSASGGAPYTEIFGSTAITATGWHHVAATRSGTTLRLFRDGVQEGGNVAFSGAIYSSAQPFTIAREGDSGFPWNGVLDEFRLSIGTPRWTANFTPPNVPYY